ncbi:MAG TPA: hypothetical protein DEH25_11995 [Chloroflexi bacterium]|nr:hypothetical protein [Chloroflexota bacterium]HBY08250.1 hypothetical protein [Chloroflexota bacterium]
MKSKWVDHNGKKIWHIDLSGFGSNVHATQDELEAASQVTLQQPENSLLVLSDLSGTTISTQLLKIAQKSSADTNKYVKKTAVIGITGYRKYFIDAVSAFSGQKFSAFNTMEEALDWLAQD